MKIAVVTPHYKTPKKWLDQCLESVQSQTIPCTHFLVSDGDESQAFSSAGDIRVIQLPRPHNDYGNTPRAIGSICAMSQGFDAIAYLDSDNWYQPNHLESLLALHYQTGAVVCTSSRTLHHPNGTLLGPCPEVDGETFVDTSCFFITREAFSLVSVWYTMEKKYAVSGDRVIWENVKAWGLRQAHTGEATLAYRTLYKPHYYFFELQSPDGSKDGPIWPPIGSKGTPIWSPLFLKNYVWPPSWNSQKRESTVIGYQTLSVCMMIQNAEQTLAITLESLCGIYDELIVVDGGSTDSTCEIALRYGARIIHSKWSGNHSQQRNAYLQEVKTNWVFVIDSDEFIDRRTLEFLQYVKLQGSAIDTDNFWIPRKWISPLSQKHYVKQDPHYPDPQHRLFRYGKDISYHGQIHEIIHGLNQSGELLTNLSIYHLDLFINSEQKRWEKVLRYSRVSSQDGMPHYYLPDSKHLQLEEWSYQDILPSVQSLLTSLSMKCKICESGLYKFANAKVLNKYNIDYYKCSNCGYIQTEEPYWLKEAYSNAIASSDVGLVFRNTMFSNVSSNIIYNLFNHNASFLDYGGGYGLFVRMMRDLGFNFFWHDKFCENIFAKGFDISEQDGNHHELVTAFEVFEHFVDPINEIEQILRFSRNILFSTELLPLSNPKPYEWWYYATHEGQHVSIYTEKALSIVAEKFDLKLYSNGSSLHLLTEKEIQPLLFNSLSRYEHQGLKKTSLLQGDYLKAISNSVSNTNNHPRTALSNEDCSINSLGDMTVVLDGVFFQLYNTGIARVWKSLLEEWVDNGFAKHIVVLDRAGTAPKIAGIQYRTVPLYDYNNLSTDREMLQQVCDEEGANLFISTYYTTPLSTPSVFLAHDMIPELIGCDLNHPMWREKHCGIAHATTYIAVSENTARDLVKFFPHLSVESIMIAPNGVDHKKFFPASTEEVNQFKTKYGVSKPYFILVGERVGVDNYKNAFLFFKAFSQLSNCYDFDIVCVGGQPALEPGLKDYTPDTSVHILQLTDDELGTAYSDAVALVYPSKYEGFGLPIVEAMACGCPVITCPNGSIPEVAGQAALYVNSDDINGLVNALLEIQEPDVRNSLIAVGFEQAKKFSWSAMAQAVSSALIETAHLTAQNINLPSSLTLLSSYVKQYQESSEQSVLVELCQARRQLAGLWLSSSTEQLVSAYRSSIGKAHQTLLSSGIKNEQLTDTEQTFAAELVSHIAKGRDQPKAVQYLLAAMLYCHADQLPLPCDLTYIPNWLLNDYLKFVFSPLNYFQKVGEADSYYQYMEQWVNYLHSHIISYPDSKQWQDIATYFANVANFIPLYFNGIDLKNIYTKRADIIGFSLKSRGCQIDYEFPEHLPEERRIRLGILAAHFGPQTETFATLPIYKNLNRDVFEIILYTLNTSNHRLERYCAGHADALVKLPADLPSQVQTIRETELDILFISTNVTAVSHPVTLLALHRLARLQMVDANSPVTTGMRHVDYYISSKLSELEEAQQHYTETLVTLDSSPQCFDFGTEEQLLTTTSVSREGLGISKNAVVYVSGANYYKIIPELETAWARIIASVDNSILLLYPFNPNWSSSYPAMAFRRRIADTFAKHGLSKDRLIILDAAPNRADVKERLKLGDIYIDSYPYSGMTSLIDPLELGLPTVAWEAEFSRSKKGASLLRELQIPDLIANSEESYLKLAIALGTNPELRKQKSDQIKQRMLANPGFLDSRAYSAQMGALFQELSRKQQAAALKDNLKLRDTNLIIFPDWSQPEDILLQDLMSVVKAVVTHRDRSQITLLIDASDVSDEDANLALSTVMMNLLMEEDLDVTDGPEISLIGKLSEVQWQALLPHIQTRISLENENQRAIATVGVENIPSCELVTSAIAELFSQEQEPAISELEGNRL